MTYINRDELLYSVQAPGQYAGGEFGSIRYDEDQDLRMAISFPDLYSIGMSNQAIKIIYSLANSIEGVQCERVFAPMEDMEKLLKEKEQVYFTLEKAIPLHELDIIAFSIGYELCFTNLLNILELGQIPLRNKDREDHHPVIIAGGPAITNPIPFSDFVDFVYIGEGEEGYQTLLREVVELKRAGKGRKEIIDLFKDQSYLWYEGKEEKTRIIKYTNFGKEKGWTSALPVPTVEAVQDHGVVEIMRGCPNKCRFCHAGVYYRPKREKDWNLIVDEIDFLVNEAGYRDITLSSLSSGDFTDIAELVDLLNERYKGRHVSFALPSLRVNSMSLGLIEKISKVKKSGLTFAVEAANEEWQHAINKDVSEEKIIEILREAKRRGWRQAKFYFMIGLPVSIDHKEEDEMIAYLDRIQRATKINLTVNIGTFIPKVFTPFKGARQLEEMASLEKILYIKRNVGKGIRVSFHSPFASLIEAVLSRGDKKAGELFYQAYLQGARLDSWDDHLDRDLWKKILSEADWEVEKEICSPHDTFPELYDTIDLGASQKSLDKENEMSLDSTLSDSCSDPCTDHCSICNKSLKVRNAQKIENPLLSCQKDSIEEYHPYLFVMQKEGAARFTGHLDFSRAVERTFYRCSLPLKMSQGFNPKPKIEFANPISLGAASNEEIVLAELTSPISIEETIIAFNKRSPEGMVLADVLKLPVIEGRKKLTLMKNWGGADWLIEHTDFNASQLIEQFSQKIDELEIGASFQILEDPSLKIRQRFSKEKVLYNSLNKFIRENFDDYDKFRIKRLKSWAVNKRGELVSYKDFF
ncbi:MAG: TIGR03936 family radical SAM-associated protein [Spirochaetales bacterium]|nr:TIGR03936 family radical SAM-associated protein [Spirochaetales bacterium]